MYFQTLQREIEDYKLSITELEKSSKQLKNEREDYLTELEVLRENKEVSWPGVIISTIYDHD